jgi:hypothetical protein
MLACSPFVGDDGSVREPGKFFYSLELLSVARECFLLGLVLQVELVVDRWRANHQAFNRWIDFDNAMKDAL